MNFNWIDWVVVAVVVYHLVTGWQTGLIFLIDSMVAFLASLWLAMRYHLVVGNFLSEKFGLHTLWSTLAGYIIVAFVSQTVIAEGIGFLLKKLPKQFFASNVNRVLGMTISVINALLVVTFLFLILSLLPIRGTVKKDIKQSLIGRQLLVFADRYGGGVKTTVDETAREVIKFLTIHPQSRERIPLDIGKSELTIDIEAEKIMLDLVNRERANAGVATVRHDKAIIEVARAHSRDMFERKYFSHISPDGDDTGDRMEKAGFSFQIAGENLAYAPDVQTAHEGLMNSEGHRRNILDPQFHRIGIGVIDGGIYGKMFVQNFTD